MTNNSSSSMLSQISSSNSSTSPRISQLRAFLLCESESLSLLMIVTSSQESQNSKACCCSSMERYFFIPVYFWLPIEQESPRVYSEAFRNFMAAQGDTRNGVNFVFSRQKQAISSQRRSFSLARHCLMLQACKKLSPCFPPPPSSTLKSITYFLLASLFLVSSLKLYGAANCCVTSRTTLINSLLHAPAPSDPTGFPLTDIFHIQAISVVAVYLSNRVRRVWSVKAGESVLRWCAITLFLIWQHYLSTRKQSSSSEGLRWLLSTSISLRTVSTLSRCWGRGFMRVCSTISVRLLTMLPASLSPFINLNYIAYSTCVEIS